MTEQEKVKVKVEAEKTVTIKIPIDPRNPGDMVVPVGINGHFWQIRRGEKVEVWSAVAEILESANYI